MKQQEDFVGWGLQSPVEAQVAALGLAVVERVARGDSSWLARVTCPALAIHGDADRCQPPERSQIVADVTGGDLVIIEAVGTCRWPVSPSS